MIFLFIFSCYYLFCIKVLAPIRHWRGIDPNIEDANQMALLFDWDAKTIRKHISNVIAEELADSVVVAKFATTTQHGAIEASTNPPKSGTSFYQIERTDNPLTLLSTKN